MASSSSTTTQNHVTPTSNVAFELKYNEKYVSLPPNEIVKAALATLGLTNEKNSHPSSNNLINNSPLRINLIWGLNVDIVSILFSDLIAKLLNSVKGYRDKVAKLLKTFEPLILSYVEVNADRASDKKAKPKKSVAETQHAKDSRATVDITKSLDTSKPAEDVANEPEIAAIENVIVLNFRALITEKDEMANDYELISVGTININQAMKDVSSDPKSMPDDEIMSILEDNEEAESDKELSSTDEVVAGTVINEILTKINTGISTSNVSDATATEVPTVSDNKSSLVSKLADVQELVAKALCTKKNVPRENLSFLGISLPDKFTDSMDSVLPRLIVVFVEE
ncbi:hypothetical protein Tco_0751399 [Tanacetum coccineum]|uniref:Uncharacterized protein n=1 Tax=Tanacetum coccineum TaxID=301880 RepID=A0ABQ4Z7E7_9ASTR